MYPAPFQICNYATVPSVNEDETYTQYATLYIHQKC